MSQYGYIGRKMRLPQLKEKPAIIIAAFGSSRRGRVALNLFSKKLNKKFPDHEIFWAYTSEILCKKMNIPSLTETLAEVEAKGFRKVVVQPLHIFPTTEYQQMAETCEFFAGLRVFLGETLLHRWEFIEQTIAVVQQEFLKENEGLNLLAFHGTSLVDDPVNSVFLGLERLVSDLYTNVMMASIKGTPDRRAVFNSIKKQNLSQKHKKIKIIPMIYLAGLHAEKDLMGDEKSWRSALEEIGFKVECSKTMFDGEEYFKGLAFYPEIIDFFIERLERTMELSRYY